ncbi:MAG: hypothetical protein OCC49_15820 [Fibrobacterales bacterium]
MYRWNTLYKWCCCLVVLLSCPLVASGGYRLAVLDFFETESESVFSRKEIANIFEVELKKKMVYTLFERGILKDVLNEPQNRHLLKCKAIQCQITIGAVLGVEKIIVGSLYTYTGFSTFQIEIIEINTGYIEKAFSFDFSNYRRNALITAIKKGVTLVAQYSIATTPLELQHSFSGRLPNNSRVRPLTITRIGESDKSSGLTIGLYLVGALAFGVGTYYEMEVNSAYTKYSTIESDDQEVYNTQWRNVKVNELNRNVAYSISGAFLLAGISYTLFF